MAIFTSRQYVVNILSKQRMVHTIDKQSEMIGVRPDVAKQSDVGTLARKTKGGQIDDMAAAMEAGISLLQVADQLR